MRRTRTLVLLVTFALVASVILAGAALAGSDHEIARKLDESGSFTNYGGSYVWPGVASDATWEYRLHIKEAVDGEFSVGTLQFRSGDVKVVGKVEATKSPYPWADLAAVGTARFDGQRFYFMFLVNNDYMWFALSETSYDAYWASGTWWGQGLREYQFHSTGVNDQFPLDFKVIH